MEKRDELKRLDLNLFVSVAVCLIPFVISAVFYERLPEQVAVHFAVDGTPDRYFPKIAAAFGIPFFLLCLHLFMLFMPENNFRKNNLPKTLRHMLKWLVPVVAIVIQTGIISYAVGVSFNFIFYVMLFMGVMFMVIGNYLPKCRKNNIFGYKFPWTLQDDDNWNKTHRLAGFLWVLGGLTLVIGAFFEAAWLISITLFILVPVPIIFSYKIRKKAED